MMRQPVYLSLSTTLKRRRSERNDETLCANYHSNICCSYKYVKHNFISLYSSLCSGILCSRIVNKLELSYACFYGFRPSLTTTSFTSRDIQGVNSNNLIDTIKKCETYYVSKYETDLISRDSRKLNEVHILTQMAIVLKQTLIPVSCFVERAKHRHLRPEN